MYAMDTDPSTMAGSSRSKKPGSAPAVTGKMRPLDAEEVLADEAGDEGRHRDEQQRDDQDDRIVPLALLEAGDRAEHARRRSPRSTNAIRASFKVTGNARPISSMTG